MAKNYQDVILNQVRKENIPVTVYLTNGFQLRGIVCGFDNYVIILESEGKQQMIYKHAVSTIIPVKTIKNLNDSFEPAQTETSNGAE